MNKLFTVAALAAASLFSVNANATVTTSKTLYKTPALAARNIIAAKISKTTARGANGFAFHGSWLDAKFTGLSAGKKARQYEVTGNNFRTGRQYDFKISVLKVKGGWRAYEAK